MHRQFLSILTGLTLLLAGLLFTSTESHADLIIQGFFAPTLDTTIENLVAVAGQTTLSNTNPTGPTRFGTLSFEDSASVQFNRFDPSLGTLNMVTFFFENWQFASSAYAAWADFTCDDSVLGVCTGRDVGATITLRNLGVSLSVNSGLVGNEDFQATDRTDSCSDTAGVGGGLAQCGTFIPEVTELLSTFSFDVTGAGLSDYIGPPGSTLEAEFAQIGDVNFSTARPFSDTGESLLDAPCPGGSGSTICASFSTEPSNTMFVFYDFTPVVPEPGTLALLGSGLAGIGFVTRRLRMH
jgi:hypothetical protein